VVAAYIGLLVLLGIAPEDRLVYRRVFRRLGRLRFMRRVRSSVRRDRIKEDDVV
jgi:hypothetical protein